MTSNGIPGLCRNCKARHVLGNDKSLEQDVVEIGSSEPFVLASGTEGIFLEKSTTLQIEPQRTISEFEWLKQIREHTDEDGRLESQFAQYQYEQVLTDMVEARRGQFMTSLRFEVVDGQVCAKDKHKTPIKNIIRRDVESAKEDARRDPALSFYVERAEADYRLAEAVDRMTNDVVDYNTVITFSPFPEDIYEHHPQAVEQKQYRPQTRRSLVWLHRKVGPDQVELSSIGVDGKSLHELKDIYAQLGGDISEVITTQDLVDRPLQVDLDNDNFIDTMRYLVDVVELDEEDSMKQVERAGNDIINYVVNQELRLAYADTVADLGPELLHFARYSRSLRKKNGEPLIDALTAKQIEHASSDTSAPLAPILRQSLWRLLHYSSWAQLEKRFDLEYRVTVDGSQASVSHKTLLASAHQAMLMQQVRPGCAGGSGLQFFGAEGGEFENINPSSFSAETGWSYSPGYCRDPKQRCPSKGDVTDVGPCSICRHCEKLF